jgi:hypothetical protein
MLANAAMHNALQQNANEAIGPLSEEELNYKLELLQDAQVFLDLHLSNLNSQ